MVEKLHSGDSAGFYTGNGTRASTAKRAIMGRKMEKGAIAAAPTAREIGQRFALPFPEPPCSISSRP
jgi:hypothetical protein